MALFLLIALLTLAVVTLLVRPLLRDAQAPAGAEGFNAAIYRDQLAEIERDVAREALPGAEAAAVRAEIERRLLGLPKAEQGAQPARPAPRMAALVLAGAVTICAGALYLGLGSPQAATPSAEIAAAGGRTASSDAMHAEMDGLIAKLNERLKLNPGDVEGWALLARSQIRLGRIGEAVVAYAQAMRLTGGEDRQISAEYAEARVMAANGRVDEEARIVFERLLEASPGDPQARYYLALERGQSGDLPGALKEWRALRADSPEGAPWLETLDRQIAQAEAAIDQAPSRGPSSEQVAAAEAMPAGDRQAMIESMVAGLAERLKQSPNDLDGWRRLARAYDVLGRDADAATAHARVLALAPKDVDALWRLGEIAAAKGDAAEARRRWRALEATLPQNAPQRAQVREALAALPAG